MGNAVSIKDGLAIAASNIKKELTNEQAKSVTIGLFGMGGAGKSSLVNALVGRDVMEVGIETDCSRAEQRAQHNGLTFIDLPGFGTEMFPANEFDMRFKLDRFDVLLCVHNSGGRVFDHEARMFRGAMQRSRAAIFVASKWDVLQQPGKTKDQLEAGLTADVRRQLQRPQMPVHFVSICPIHGIASLQDAIWDVLDVAKRERWAKAVKAYTSEFLLKKREACERQVLLYSGLAAANGFNPVPGLAEAVDLGTMLKLFAEIRDAYGLSPARLKWLETHAGPVGAKLASSVAALAGPMAMDALITLLKRFAGRTAAREAARYIPIIGQIVSASLGFGITYWAGREYLSECEQLVTAVLAQDLEMPAAGPEDAQCVIDVEAEVA